MAKYQKKPTVIEAVQLQRDNVREVYEFVHGSANPNNHSSFYSTDYWDTYVFSVCEGGMPLKTPESGEGTQIAAIGDYVVKGYTKELGYHFWPVKPSYFEDNYIKVEE